MFTSDSNIGNRNHETSTLWQRPRRSPRLACGRGEAAWADEGNEPAIAGAKLDPMMLPGLPVSAR
eukprot:15464085-Alexandrium_andersonii.AAC.1